MFQSLHFPKKADRGHILIVFNNLCYQLKIMLIYYIGLTVSQPNVSAFIMLSCHLQWHIAVYLYNASMTDEFVFFLIWGIRVPIVSALLHTVF